MYRPTRLLASAITVPAAALVIALAASVLDGWSWQDPKGLLTFALLFVSPFTIVGSFLIVCPAHYLGSRMQVGKSLQYLILFLAALAGAIMLQPISNEAVYAGVLGAVCGAATSALWLVTYSMLSKFGEHA